MNTIRSLHCRWYWKYQTIQNKNPQNINNLNIAQFIMEQLTWKMDLEAKCPHCNESDYYTFYLNADTLICNKCDKEFSIEIYTKDIEVRSSK